MTNKRSPCQEKAAGTADGRLAALWHATVQDLQRVAAAMVGADAARDALQDVYVAAMKHGAKCHEDKELRRWLFRVTVNRCCLEHRQRKRHRDVLSRLASWFSARKAIDAASDEVVEREGRRVVRAALSGLDVDLRAALVLRYFQGMNSREIAAILNIPEGTVRSRLRTGRLKLADELRKAGYDER